MARNRYRDTTVREISVALFTWKDAQNGDFDTAANWLSGSVPTATDDVAISAAGTYTVTSSTSNTVNTLEIAASATLAVAAGTFAINNGSGPSGLAGTIAVGDAADLSLAGTINNTGTIKLGSTGDTTEIRIAGPSVVLQGGGTISLSNNAANYIFGNSGAFALTNINNTIAGAGQLGDGQLTLVNGGQIIANQVLALVLDTSNFVNNSGILKSTNTSANAGGLVIQNTSIDNSGSNNAGKIEAIGANTHVDLQNATIVGGMLITSGGGVIRTVAASTLDGQSEGVAVENTGLVQVTDGTSLTLDGVIDNTGTIQMMASASTTDIRLGSQAVTLEGGGQLTMSNNANNRLYGNSGAFQLINVNNTISGAGQLGAGQVTLTNQINGVIDASLSTALTVQTGGGLTVNLGLMENTGTGGLVLTNTVDNASGTIKASGAGTHVDLAGAYIEGGTLLTALGGKIQVVSGNATLDGLTVGALTIKGTLTVTDQTSLTLDGTIDNTGTIAMDAVSTSGNTDLRLNGQTIVLEGGGRLTLSNDANNRIYGNSGAYQLLNVDNTISGAGQLGSGQLSFINQGNGVVDADQTQALTLNTGGTLAFNSGLLEATSTGGLVIANTIDNAGGIIQAVGSGAVVNLAGGYIEGGTLKTANGGVIQTASGNANLDGTTAGGIVNAATVQVIDGTSLTVEGAIFNSGTVKLNSSVDNTDLRINSQNVFLKGGGSIVLSNSGTNRIYGNSGTDVLNNVDNTIVGAGQLGAGQLTLVNQIHGVIDANQRMALTLNFGGNVMTNAGLLEATNTGGLAIATTIDNAGGSILARGTGVAVNLDGGTIEGGALGTVGAGVIETGSGGSNLDGITAGKVTLSGSFNVIDSTALTLEGVIDNTGTINLDSVGNDTDIRLNSETVTLTGGGKLKLTNFSTNRIYGNSGFFTLKNLNNTIIGGGQFGAGQMQFVNSGKIESAYAAGLVIALGSGLGTNTASGLIEGSGAGGLTLSSGFIANSGRIVSLDGSFVTFTGATTDNNVSGVLTGGTWEASSLTHGSTLSISGGAVTEDAASIILSGAGSVFQAGNGSTFTPVEQSLTTIDPGGALEILSTRNYTTALRLSDAGLLQLGGGAFKSAGLTVVAGGDVLGFGTVTGSVADAGTVEAKGGQLSIVGAVGGSGGLNIEASSSLELEAAAGSTATVTFAGTKGKLILSDGSAFAGTVSGFAVSDAIDVTTVAFSDATHLSYAPTTHDLTVTDGTHTVSIKLFQQYVAAGFHEVSDGSGGTTITYTTPSAHMPDLAPHGR
jgi:hypothetical protein